VVDSRIERHHLRKNSLRQGERKNGIANSCLVNQDKNSSFEEEKAKSMMKVKKVEGAW